MKKIFQAICLLTFLCLAMSVNAKSYKFDINQTTAETCLSAKHKDHNNFKIIRAVAVDKNADKAIEKAMMASVADAMFHGIQGSTNPTSLEVIPQMQPILQDGVQAYYNNKKFFDEFFKKGIFTQFIRRALTDYPSGVNNVKDSNGTRIVDIFILNQKGLMDYLESNGFKVVTNSLRF